MTDGQLFLLVFAAIYLSDCLAWASHAQTGFVSWWNKVWKAKRPNAFAGNERGGFIFGSPFPPLGSCFFSSPWLLSITKEGISTLTVESPNPGGRVVQSERHMEWKTLVSIRRERSTLYLNDEVFAKLPGIPTAHRWAKLLSRLNRLSPEGREDEIHRELNRSLNPRRVARRLQIFLKATNFLSFYANLLFCFWFMVIPISYVFLSGKPSFVMIVIEAFILMAIAAVSYLRLHGRLFPELKGEGWQHFFVVLLAPQFTIRSRDALARYYFAESHVLAVAKTLLSEGDFEKYGSAYMRDLENPVGYFVPDAMDEGTRRITEDFSTNYLRPAVERSIEIEREAYQGEYELHCPRCFVSYSEGAEVCHDCSGMELIGAQSSV